MLAIFPVVDATRNQTCVQAIDAAAEAMEGVDRLNVERQKAGKPVAKVDLALHLGEVLYGNVGAVDRLDFTVIGPAVNEVSRIETLCEPLGRKVLISAELASAVGDSRPLEPLGYHTLRRCGSQERSSPSILAVRRRDRARVRYPRTFQTFGSAERRRSLPA